MWQLFPHDRASFGVIPGAFPRIEGAASKKTPPDGGVVNGGSLVSRENATDRSRQGEKRMFKIKTGQTLTMRILLGDSEITLSG